MIIMIIMIIIRGVGEGPAGSPCGGSRRSGATESQLVF